MKHRMSVKIKSIKTFITMMFLIMIVLPVVARADLDVLIIVDSFFVRGDIISFRYTITSTEDIEIIYTPYVDCPKASKPLMNYKTASLQKDVPLADTYEYVRVTESMEPQTCTAFIQLRDPYEQKFERVFEIEALPSIELRILTCKDVSCNTESKTFVKNSKIYLSYSSNISDISTEASLTLPDKTIQRPNVPGSIKASQTGTYELQVMASKAGYKSTAKTVQFGTVESHANVKSADTGTYDTTTYLMIAIAVVVIVAVGFMLYRIKKRRDRSSKLNDFQKLKEEWRRK